jgi:hypothetical protein
MYLKYNLVLVRLVRLAYAPSGTARGEAKRPSFPRKRESRIKLAGCLQERSAPGAVNPGKGKDNENRLWI